MKFENTAEAFNHYKNSTKAEIETRAAQIKGTIESDPKADITSLNIEIEGLNQAMKNTTEKEGDKKEPETRSFNPITGMNFNNAPTGDVLASAEYRTAFFKNLLNRDMTAAETRAWNAAKVERRADAFNTVSDAAGVIPTQTLNEVISKARTMGGLLPHCRAFNIPSKASVPIATPLDAAGWNTEGTAVETEEATINNVDFGSYEIIKVLSVSASIAKMSIPAFEAYLTEELTATVMAALANGVINGTGVKEGVGIEKGITWGATNSVTFTGETNTKLAYADIVDAMALLKRGYAMGAKVAMNNTTLYKHVYSLTDDNKRPIFIQDLQTDKVGKMLGFEVVIDDNIAADTIFFGNFKSYMGYNMIDGIAVESSTQSSFTSGKVDYRALAIADCKPLIPEAFVKIHKAA